MLSSLLSNKYWIFNITWIFSLRPRLDRKSLTRTAQLIPSRNNRLDSFSYMKTCISIKKPIYRQQILFRSDTRFVDVFLQFLCVCVFSFFVLFLQVWNAGITHTRLFSIFHEPLQTSLIRLAMRYPDDARNMTYTLDVCRLMSDIEHG